MAGVGDDIWGFVGTFGMAVADSYVHYGSEA